MNWEIIYPLLWATGLGGIIGLERQIHGKPAGFRTNILICLGAAMYTVISKLMGTVQTMITSLGEQTGQDASSAEALNMVTGMMGNLTTQMPVTGQMPTPEIEEVIEQSLEQSSEQKSKE